MQVAWLLQVTVCENIPLALSLAWQHCIGCFDRLLKAQVSFFSYFVTAFMLKFISETDKYSRFKGSNFIVTKFII